MADILIHGMEMPNSCGRRRCCFAYECKELKKYETTFRREYCGERLKDCPLVEIPPHGRLIDADALWAEIHNICNSRYAGIITNITCIQQILSALRHAPTVIPAEEGDKL